MRKCYYCEKTEDLVKDSIQVKGDFLLVDLCPEHHKARERERELTRKNYAMQFGENWH
jgi:hypothetical protein